MDLPHGRLRDKVQDVGTGAAEAHDRDPVKLLKLRGHDVDLSPARSGVDVIEGRLPLLLLGCDNLERLRPAHLDQ